MKAYLIDPFTKTIETVEYSGNYKQIYSLLGCDLYDRVTITDAGDDIWFDDEGLYKHQQAVFHIVHEEGLLHGSMPLAGRGLVLGSDADGASAEPSITLEALSKRIFWTPPAEARREIDRRLDEGIQVFPINTLDDIMKAIFHGRQS